MGRGRTHHNSDEMAGPEVDRIHQLTRQPSPFTGLPAGHAVNFDHWGSVWGTSNAAETEADIARARAEGATIHGWESTDLNGRPLRVVRVDHPQFGIDICAFATEGHPAVSA